MSNRPGTKIEDNTAEGRYEIRVDGELAGYARYRVEDGRVVLFDTQVDPAHCGKGLGRQLADAALEDIRTRGSLIDPRCDFIAKHIREHPEHIDLVTPELREQLLRAA